MKKGFTLMEIALIIALLGIMTMLSLTAFRAMRRSSLRQKAKVEASELAHALLAFRQTYGHWPNEARAECNGDETEIIVADDSVTSHHLDIADVVKTLSGENESDNPRGLTFMELPERAADDPFIPHDPWGRPYVIVLSRVGSDATIAYIERGIHANLTAPNGEAVEIESPEEVAVFSWGDPAIKTDSGIKAQMIKSWSVK